MNATVSWLGNSYGGGDSADGKPQWVSYHAADIDVDSDGWIFTNTVWEEGGREGGIYSPTGEVVGLMRDLHGWGRLGGNAVASGPVASDRVYLGMSQWPLGWDNGDGYPLEDGWICVRTYDRKGNVVPCPPSAGCRGYDKSMLVICVNCTDIAGLATSPDGAQLYVSDSTNNVIHVYNTSGFNLVMSWPWPNPGKIAVEPQTGNVWIAQNVASGVDVQASLICKKSRYL